MSTTPTEQKHLCTERFTSLPDLKLFRFRQNAKLFPLFGSPRYCRVESYFKLLIFRQKKNPLAYSCVSKLNAF